MSTWIKVYNSLPAHPKMLAANAGQPCNPGWLFACGSCYSNEHLTDGFIPTYALSVVSPGTTKNEAAATRLVEAGLWHVEEGGWRIHDYNDVQRSSEEIRERREKDSARKANGRSTRSPSGQFTEAGVDSDEDSDEIPCGVRRVDVDVEKKAEEEKTTTSGADRADERATADDVALCRLLAEQAKERNSKFKVKSRARWLTDMRRLRELDGNSPAEIEDAIRWVFRDSFWGGVIQSPGNLREHFAAIWDRMGRSNVVPIAGRQSPSDLLRQINANQRTA